MSFHSRSNYEIRWKVEEQRNDPSIDMLQTDTDSANFAVRQKAKSDKKIIQNFSI